MATRSKPHQEADETATHKPKRGMTIFYPRGLNITWGNDRRYWRIDNATQPKNSVAELMQVSWLEVTCSTNNVEAGKTYKVGFNVSLKPDAFGWNGIEVYVMAKIGKMGKFIFKKVSLAERPINQKFTIPDEKDPLNIKVSEDQPQDYRSVYVGLYEVWSEKWKGGLKIHDAFVQEVGST